LNDITQKSGKISNAFFHVFMKQFVCSFTCPFIPTETISYIVANTYEPSRFSSKWPFIQLNDGVCFGMTGRFVLVLLNFSVHLLLVTS